MNLLVPGSLLAVSLGLGAVLAYQAVAPIQPIAVRQTIAAPRAELSAPLPGDVPPPQENFASINARFLFSPERQAVAEPFEAGRADMPPPDVTLIGVIIGPQKSVAILKTQGAAVATSASIGQMIEGWRVVSIGPGRVVFHANVTDYEVKLRSAASAPGQPLPETTTPAGGSAQ